MPEVKKPPTSIGPRDPGNLPNIMGKLEAARVAIKKVPKEVLEPLQKVFDSQEEMARVQTNLNRMLWYMRGSTPAAHGETHGIFGTDPIDQSIKPWWVNVKSFGAKGDGSTDDTVAIRKAIVAMADHETKALYFPAGRYLITKYTLFYNLSDVLVFGPGATIVYNSANTANVAGGLALTNDSARAAFYILNCSRVHILGLAFEGNSTQVDITINIGVGVYSRNSSNVVLENCFQTYGASLCAQDTQSGDRDLVIFGGKSYACRSGITLGIDATIINHHFELPTTVGYDRVGSNGSSHAIYIFAGRSDIEIIDCTFRNIRTWGVKVSGTASPIRDIRIQGNYFYDCGGGVLVGADDTNEHTGIIIAQNYFVDCATNRTGWCQQYVINVLGSSGTKVIDNVITFSRNASGSGPGAATLAGIAAFRYLVGSQLCENLTISRNTITGLSGTTPASIVNKAIYIDTVNGGDVSDNETVNVGAVGVFVTSSLAATTGVAVEQNHITNSQVAFELFNTVHTIVRNNRLTSGSSTTGAQLRFSGDTDPFYWDNFQQKSSGTRIPMTVSGAICDNSEDLEMMGLLC